MLVMLFVLGAINFADKAVLGLAAIPIIKELHLSPAQYGVVSGSLFWLFSLSSVLVTAWADVVGTKKILALLAATFRQDRASMALAAIMFALLLAQRFWITPEIVRIGRLIDFNPQSPERQTFWMFHNAYSGIELAKLALGLVLSGRSVFGSK